MQAIARMSRALNEYKIAGVRTTLPFASWLMQQPRFIAGELSTDFIAEEWDTRSKSEAVQADEGGAAPSPEQIAAIVGSLLLQEQMEQEQQRRRPAAESEHSRWRDAGRSAIL